MSEYIKISDIPFRDLAEGHNTDIKVLVAFASDIASLPTIEFNKEGEWEEKETFHNADDNPIIEEWQSAKCSVCNKYHTTPYMYSFSNYNYCPNCGARMRLMKGN